MFKGSKQISEAIHGDYIVVCESISRSDVCLHSLLLLPYPIPLLYTPRRVMLSGRAHISYCPMHSAGVRNLTNSRGRDCKHLFPSTTVPCYKQATDSRILAALAVLPGELVVVLGILIRDVIKARSLVQTPRYQLLRCKQMEYEYD